uniref:Uncharacterized protein n=1 Tax=Vespula pensylvanica TaxID=30213 RepID=A0A834P8U8_VESPE|nr:hypothetical protein H0235_005205 [Vespula pensylvanica]
MDRRKVKGDEGGIGQEERVREYVGMPLSNQNLCLQLDFGTKPRSEGRKICLWRLRMPSGQRGTRTSELIKVLSQARETYFVEALLLVFENSFTEERTRNSVGGFKGKGNFDWTTFSNSSLKLEIRYSDAQNARSKGKRKAINFIAPRHDRSRFMPDRFLKSGEGYNNTVGSLWSQLNSSYFPTSGPSKFYQKIFSLEVNKKLKQAERISSDFGHVRKTLIGVGGKNARLTTGVIDRVNCIGANGIARDGAITITVAVETAIRVPKPPP